MGFRVVVGEALTNVRRNGLMSLASAATVAISLFILSIFLLMAVNVDNLVHTIESQIEVRLYLEDGLDEAAIASLQKQVEAHQGVTEVIYVSKEDALATLREQLGEENADLLEGVDEMDPLRDSLRVFTDGPAWVETVSRSLSELDGVVDVSYAPEIVQRLLKLAGAVRIGGIGLVVLMVFATLFVISNTVRLTILARSQEVSIMKLVGATNWFIRWPFLLEGMFLGLAGAALAGLAAWQGYTWAVSAVYRGIPYIPVVPLYPLAWRLGLVLLAFGGIIGATGSTVSLRRFLRV